MMMHDKGVNCNNLTFLQRKKNFFSVISITRISYKQVLHYDLKNIVTETKITSAKDEEILLRELCSIAKRHTQLFGYANCSVDR